MTVRPEREAGHGYICVTGDRHLSGVQLTHVYDERADAKLSPQTRAKLGDTTAPMPVSVLSC
jgi:hypothetical protein